MEMENAVVTLRDIDEDSVDYKPIVKKLRKDQEKMRKKLEALLRFEKKAKEEISDGTLTVIRLLGRLNLNYDEEQESVTDASNANQTPPAMTFIKGWTIDRLASEKAEAARESDPQIEQTDDNLQGDNTTGATVEEFDSSGTSMEGEDD